MTVYHATQTLAAIDAAIAADDGNAYRHHLGVVLPHMNDAYRDDEDAYRSHLGASVIGGDCERAIAYGYRWAHKRPPRGKKDEPAQTAHARMVRLWNRGHLEEGRLIALLLVANIAVYQQDSESKQYRIVDLGGHFSGSCDGILLGVPELPPGVPCLGEFKTYGTKYFKALVDDGLYIAKRIHYIQMQTYMAKLGLFYGLYLAVNKDTDELYAELIMYDGDVYARQLERAKRIIYDHTLPPRIRGATPSFRRCKTMCDFKDVCFHTVKVDRNCRTCQHWFPMPDGTFQCAQKSITLSKQDQIAGCTLYTMDPELK
jgi:hypothetical protein